MPTLNMRKLSGLCILLLYVCIGVPLWYKLTTIFRAQLPINYINSLHESKFQDVHMVIPVYIKSSVYRFPDLHTAVQTQINYLLDSKPQLIPWSLQVLPYDEDIIADANTRNVSYHVIDLVLDNDVGLYISRDADETIVFFSDETVVSNDLPFFIAQTVVEYTFKLEFTRLGKYPILPPNNISIAYTPTVHLSLSLLTGDGNPVTWEIDSALKKYFSPIRSMISPITNFTVDTNIIYYNDLNLHKLDNISTVTWEDISHTLDLSELSTLNDYDELVSLNLAVVFPSNKTDDGLDFITPTSISNSTFTNSTNLINWESFIVPRWGVLIINKYPYDNNTMLTDDYLSTVLETFSEDLLRLLDLSDEHINFATPYITLNSYKRLLTLHNMDRAVETIWSLSRLTQNFKQMSIPSEVLSNVNKALHLRLEIADLLNNPLLGDNKLWSQVLVMSNELVELCESAFFHGEMVQQNFLPQEHKIAVYLPLLGPISIIVIFGFMKVAREEGTVPDGSSTPSVGSDNEKYTEENLKGVTNSEGESETETDVE